MGADACAKGVDWWIGFCNQNPMSQPAAEMIGGKRVGADGDKLIGQIHFPNWASQSSCWCLHLLRTLQACLLPWINRDRYSMHCSQPTLDHRHSVLETNPHYGCRGRVVVRTGSLEWYQRVEGIHGAIRWCRIILMYTVDYMCQCCSLKEIPRSVRSHHVYHLG